MGLTGHESPELLEVNQNLRNRLEVIRLHCGFLMNLGDVTEKSIPKITMVSKARAGGAIATRTFIPHRCHKTIGVLGAVSVATACLLEGSCAYGLARRGTGPRRILAIEHPTGALSVVVSLNETGMVEHTAILRTARKLMDGIVFAQ